MYVITCLLFMYETYMNKQGLPSIYLLCIQNIYDNKEIDILGGLTISNIND